MRFAHVSDLHLPPLPPVSFAMVANKRCLGYLSWHLKRKGKHTLEGLEALRRDLLEQAPQHTCITGDLTNLGLEAEFKAVARWLSGLGESADVSVIPGNHDAYIATPHEQSLAQLAPWLSGDDGSTEFPYLRQRGKVAFIGVSSALPTPFFFASGRVGAGQLARLRTMLQGLGKSGSARVVMIHHPPQAGTESKRRALADAADLRGVLAEAGAELVLHGHSRHPFEGSLAGPDGPIPVLGLTSATLTGEGSEQGRYRLLTLGEKGALTVEDRCFEPSVGRFMTRGCRELRLPNDFDTP